MSLKSQPTSDRFWAYLLSELLKYTVLYWEPKSAEKKAKATRKKGGVLSKINIFIV